jgi:pyrimidine-nucleoside phosphorylase
MKPQEIISRKRDGFALDGAEISEFIDGVTDKSWADYQISALLMAMFTRGLNLDEQNALTAAMLHSGEILDFSDIDAPKADKHSTGGVGDKTSLIIAPIVAACGIAVPMISGRGLGHTGGTLDKLEAIAGYNVKLSTSEFRRIIKKCGFAMAGQTAEIAPADKKIYALRDATATVPCIPLIVASIMSKKLAEGLDALILDVKTGSGAFVEEFAESKKLAEALVKTGNAFGVKTEAVISDMNEPLGKFVGNALEVYECIKILRNESDAQMSPTLELSVELAAGMLVLSNVADTIENAKLKIENVLASGEALERFRLNIECQGGDGKVCDAPEILFEKDLIEVEIKAETSGFIAAVDTSGVGEAVSLIGGGRTRTDDKIDHAVGYACGVKIGDEVRENETIGILYCRDESQANLISEKLQKAYAIGAEKPENLELIKFIVS